MGYTPVSVPFGAAMVANAEAQTNALARAVSRINQQNRKENTSAAYDPKVAEYHAFCDHQYAALHPSVRYTVDFSRLFDFLFYHSMREKYKQGGRKKQAHGFRSDDFDAVCAKYRRLTDSSVVNPKELPDPENPVGYDLINTYKSVVYNIWMTQVSQKSNSNPWDMIFTMPCKELMTMVKARKQRIKRKNYKEKIDADFAPFASLSQIEGIEQALWQYGSTTMKGALPGLRNRFTFLGCYSGLLRSESLFLGELSDMFGIEHKRERDVHPYFIAIMQIATGKNFDVVVVDC